MDLVGLVEAAYDEQPSHQAWLDAVTRAARPLLDRGQGVLSLMVDATFAIPGPGEVLAASSAGASEPAVVASQLLHAASATEARRRRFISSGPVATLTRALGRRAPELAQLDALGFGDSVYVIAGDVYRRLCVLSSPRRAATSLPRQQRFRLEHVAAHVGAALALRFHPSSTGDRSEAILNPEGRVEHAIGMARTPASLQALGHATREREKARGRLRKTCPDEALSRWQARVLGRWTMIDAVDPDDRRHVVAIPNARWAPSSVLLTEREWQIGLLAAQGHSNKLIAYELGIAGGTVAAHLARIMAKLGVGSRVGLIAALLPARATDGHPALDGMTTAERAIAERVLAGLSNAEIARARGTSLRTVANQVAAVFRKLDTRSRAEMVAVLLGRPAR